MNTKILQKILDELKTEHPRLDYVIGMLETLIEMVGESPNGRAADLGPARLGSIPSSPKESSDDGAILDAKAKARVQNIRELAEKGTEIV